MEMANGEGPANMLMDRTKLQGVSITTKETAAGVNELRDWTVMQDQLEERRALIKWLNPNSINVEDNLKEALKHRHPETGKWLFKTDTYSSWSSGPSSVLWIHGIRKWTESFK